MIRFTKYPNMLVTGLAGADGRALPPGTSSREGADGETTANAGPGATILEREQRLSRSILWELLRRYFELRGVGAWGSGEVPQSITTSPTIALAYARVVAGWLRDWLRAGIGRGGDPSTRLDPGRPVHIIELGAGSGRFAYRFLKAFSRLRESSALKDVPVRYAMTDIAESNIASWQAHPKLQPFVEAGLLDFSRFDPCRDEGFRLRVSGDRLGPDDVANPVAVLANYVFDGLPPDAFTVRNGQLHECLVTVATPVAETDPTDPGLIGRMSLTWSDRPFPSGYYGDPDWDGVLESYRERLDDTTILFPEAALRGLGHLDRLAGGRLLLLVGDKGVLREESLLGKGRPEPAIHGSFSFPVNFHALGRVVRRHGGLVLEPSHGHDHLAVAAYLLGSPGDGHGEAALEFEESIGRSGPDEFFALKRNLGRICQHLDLDGLLAFLRASAFDDEVLMQFDPALMAYLPAATRCQKSRMSRIVEATWDCHFPIPGGPDLAFYLGTMLSAMGDHPRALTYYRESLVLHGPSAETLYHQAVAQLRVGRHDASHESLREALSLDPNYGPARALRLELEAEPDK